MSRAGEMGRATGAWALRRLKNLKSRFVPKRPHFSFITAHYCWVVGMTIVASIAIYAGGKGELSYINSLMFASGANTQAGLNPVDVNNINTFQQVVIYIFAMMSCPITLHGSVVLLRLYWFEKRFQDVVREAKNRRRTLTKTKSKARGDHPPATQGVNGRNITVVPGDGRSTKITNDGIVLDDLQQHDEAMAHKAVPNSDESDTTAHTSDDTRGSTGSSASAAAAAEGDCVASSPVEENRRSIESPNRQSSGDQASDIQHHQEKSPGAKQPEVDNLDQNPASGTMAIKFADTVKRSDGVDDDLTKFPQRRPNAEHIAILERQRNQDTEVLRIPGPRDAERGLGPRRLEEDDAGDEEDGMASVAPVQTFESRADTANVEPRTRGRQPTITIAEPERRHRDEVAADARAWGNTLETLRFRKPRVFNSGQKQTHEDSANARTRRSRISTFSTIKTALTRDKGDEMPYLSYTPTIGRNSNFIGLSLEEREELGGIEYRSLRTLLLVLLAYFWGFQLVGIVFLLPYIKENAHYGQYLKSLNISQTWWGFFTPNSAFMDLGFTLTPDSMNSFNTSSFVMMIMWFLIIIGNTGFPVMLRFCIWIFSWCVPQRSGLWEELKFLLDHPRRCFTLLFPSAANWWLLGILIILNAIDLIFFIVLDLGSGPVSDFSPRVKVVDGLFQAASTRTAGFTCVSLSALHPAVPVLYVIMMYIAIFPIAISIRRTNVYEEKSLGVYGTGGDEEDGEGKDTHALSYVGTHLRRQLSFDLWFVFLGFFILAITEGGQVQDGKFGLFDILFEIVSAYGTVGMSLGAPGTDASLCSQFSTVGKLVIIGMEIRGRHRGLPYGLDRAVLLPSESRFKKEAEETQLNMARSNTLGRSTAISTGGDPQQQPQPRRRGSSLSRTRSRSISRDRVGSNLITQFLHPGPVVSHDALLQPRRTMSSAPQPPPEDMLSPKRTRSEPIEDEEAVEDLAPLRTISRRTMSRRTDRSTEPFPDV